MTADDDNLAKSKGSELVLQPNMTHIFYLQGIMVVEIVFQIIPLKKQ